MRAPRPPGMEPREPPRAACPLESGDEQTNKKLLSLDSAASVKTTRRANFRCPQRPSDREITISMGADASHLRTPLRIRFGLGHALGRLHAGRVRGDGPYSTRHGAGICYCRAVCR